MAKETIMVKGINRSGVHKRFGLKRSENLFRIELSLAKK